ncbi:DUF1566 domain-containing protein, partial [Sulfurovum sp.]|uniref:Lcl C-terminal domain-containing protein n=1 Tax=Sulfurovum sp. TaxID=1969726 RepID=UPI0025D5BFA1
KKTGQTKSYDEAGNEVTDGSIKDDGYYQTGVTPSYTRDDATNIVTDHITGLQWQDDAAAATVSKPWVTQANYNAGNYSDTSGDTAATYCANLTLGGHSDWRLPTSEELYGIVDLGQFSPAINPVFTHTASGHYWSSTSNANSANFAWNVYFNYGGQSNGAKGNNDYVRCVRAGQ